MHYATLYITVRVVNKLCLGEGEGCSNSNDCNTGIRMYVCTLL